MDAVMVDDTRGGKVVDLLSTFGLAGNRARKPQVTDSACTIQQADMFGHFGVV